MSASAYYQRQTGQRSRRSLKDERLLERIREVHAANYYAYGSRRMWIALNRAGEPVARCTVERLMKANGICGAKRRGKPWRTTRPDPAARRRPDLVDRDFTARAGPALGRRHHVSPVLAGRRVLRVRDRRLLPPDRRLAAGQPHAHHARSRRAEDGLASARPGRGRRAGPSLRSRQPIHLNRLHPDPRRSRRPRRVGSVGDAYDNALAESFVDSFKTELIADRVWQTRSQLELAVVEYLGWFNSSRLHQALGDVPPAEFEAMMPSRSETITDTERMVETT